MDNSRFDFNEAKKQREISKQREEEERLKKNLDILSKCDLIENSNSPSWATSLKKSKSRKKLKKKMFPSGKIVSISKAKSSVRYLNEENSPKNKENAKVLIFHSEGINKGESLSLLKSVGIKAFPEFTLPSNYIQSVLVDNKAIYVSFLDKDGSGLSSSSDGGNTWTTAERKIWKDIKRLFLGNNKSIYIESTSSLTGENKPCLRTCLGNKTWFEIPLKEGSKTGPTVSFVGFSSEIFSGNCDGLFISKDKGNSWEQLIPENWLADKTVLFISQMKFAKNANQSVLYVVTNSGLIISFDEGKVWQRISSDSAKYCSALLIDSSGKIFMGLGKHGLFYSSDNGKNWQSKNSGDGLCKGPIKDIKSRNGYIYISHSSEDFDGLTKGGGLSVSSDGARNFTVLRCENSTLTSNDLGSICIGPSGSIYAATMGSGLLITDYRLVKWSSLVVETTGVFKTK